MSGTNAGTGQPLFFRCSVCRRVRARATRNPHFQTWVRGGIDNIRLTGRKRSVAHRHNARGRNSEYEREYKCLDCGHTGWSRHTDLERKERA